MVKKQKNISKREYILWIIIVILVILQGMSAWGVVKLQEGIERASDLSLSVSLKDAEEGRYKYPIVDVTEKRVYIPEAHIYLPLNDASRNMRYDFRKEGMGGESSAVYFSTSSVVGRQSGMQYESCDKMVTLTSGSASQIIDSSKIGTIQLTKDDPKDIYVHSAVSCWDEEWYASLRERLVDAVKAAKSY